MNSRGAQIVTCPRHTFEGRPRCLPQKNILPYATQRSAPDPVEDVVDDPPLGNPHPLSLELLFTSVAQEHTRKGEEFHSVSTTANNAVSEPQRTNTRKQTTQALQAYACGAV